MRCHEARNRIEAGDLDSVALLEHLRQCLSCTQLADAERRLMQSLQQAAQSTSQATTPFSILRQQIKQAAIGAPYKEKNLMSRISHQIRVHPRLSFGFALTLGVFLFATLVPFSYERITGYDATVAFAGVTEGIPQEKIEQALESVGQNDVKVSVERDKEHVNYRLSGFSSESQAMLGVLAMNVAAGTKGESKIKRVTEKFSSSLIAKAIDDVITIKLGESKGKTDQEVEQEISIKMQEAGLLNPSVKVATDSDGARMATASAFFRNPSEQDSSQITIMWQLDGDGEIQMRLFSSDSTYSLKATYTGGDKDSLQAGGIRTAKIKMDKASKGTTVKIESIGTGK
jgi:hypothetical protein